MMTSTGFALFDTAIGRCGIAWGERGVTGFLLPQNDEAGLRARLRRRTGSEEMPPPPEVRDTMAKVAALLCGELADLSGVPLDMAGIPAFHRRVYELARLIAPGRTQTYGDIAAQLGEPASARDVGHALGRNPFAIIVPCHRVLAAGGKTGGFSAPGGVATKLRLLAIEGATPHDEPDLFADGPAAAPAETPR